MADPWAAFRQPDANAAALTRNDPAQVIAPPRPEVRPTARVWGDQEATAAGLYESPARPAAEATADPWGAFRAPQATAAPAPTPVPQAPPQQQIANRFPEETYQDEALGAGLARTARGMTTGAPTSAGQKIALDFLNQGSAAGQRTTPNIDAQYKNLVSDQTFESETGEVLFRDPASGRVIPTDQNKHVALRDPADNRLKIFARTESTDEGAISAAGRLAMGGMGAGAPTARATAAAVTKAVTPTASEIFSTAKPFYRAFKNEAGKIEVPVETASGFGLRIKDALTRANLIPELAAPVYSAIGILEKGEPLTLDALQNIKRVVGRSFNSPDKNVRDAAAVASGEIGKIIGEVSQTAGKNLKTADQIHSTAMAVQDLQRKGAVADLRTGRAGYGGNTINPIRQVLSPIVQRAVEGKSTLFKPDEIQAMREIVEGTTVTNTLRTVGQLSPTKGSFATLGGMATGATAGAATVGPVGLAGAIALPALGAASNKLATVLTGKQIEHLNELVAKRSPAYSQAVAKATERYARAQNDLMTNPSPAKFAAYLTASRALSAGFQRDGIQVTSGELLRAIQGPVKAAAEDEQPQPVGVGN